MLEEQLKHIIEIGDDVAKAMAYINEKAIPFEASVENPDSGEAKPLVYELVDNGKYELTKHLLKEKPELAKVKALTLPPPSFHNRLCSLPLISALVSNEDYNEEMLDLLLSYGASLADEIDGPFGQVQVWQQLVFSGEANKLHRLLMACPPIKVTSTIDNCTLFEILEEKNTDVSSWQEKLRNSLPDKKAKILKSMRIINGFRPLKAMHDELPDLPDFTLEANASAFEIAKLYGACLLKMRDLAKLFSPTDGVSVEDHLRLKIAMETFIGVLEGLESSVILLCQQEEVLSQTPRDEVQDCLKILRNFQQKREMLLALSEQKSRFLSPPPAPNQLEEEESVLTFQHST